MIGFLESLLNLEQRYEMFTAISVDVFPGVVQTEQKHIGKWREAIEVEMNIGQSEIYPTVCSAIPSRVDIGADVQKSIPSTLSSSGRK